MVERYFVRAVLRKRVLRSDTSNSCLPSSTSLRQASIPSTWVGADERADPIVFTVQHYDHEKYETSEMKSCKMDEQCQSMSSQLNGHGVVHVALLYQRKSSIAVSTFFCGQ